MLPRKNGKTELAAAIAIYCLLFDGQTGGEIYLAAADREQAAKVFQAIVAMLRADPELLAVVEIVESQKRIVHPLSGSFCKAISAEAYSKHGFNASVVIYDELHAAQNRDLWDVLATSQGARLRAAADRDLDGGLRSTLDPVGALHAREARAGGSRDRSDVSADHLRSARRCRLARRARLDARAIRRSGDFRSLEDMRIMAQRAAEIPAQENVFRRLYLNQWTEQAARWIALAAWDACRGAADRTPGARGMRDRSLDDDRSHRARRRVPRDDGGFDVRAAAFLPDARCASAAAAIACPYDEWIRRGYLIVTPGNVVDYERVRAELQAWDADSDVREDRVRSLECDRSRAAAHAQDGFTCIPMRQGFASLSAPTKSLEKAILSRELRHDGHPVLRWCVGNVAVETRCGGQSEAVEKAQSERIDLVVALVKAKDRLDRNVVAAPEKRIRLSFSAATP